MKTHLIGPAADLAALLALTLPKKDRHRLLFTGNPGVGKTTVAEMVADQLTGSKFGVESVNGRNVTIHVVREWATDLASSCLFGSGWKVKLVNEIDLAQRDAQDALLSLLDEMPARRAFIGTSNLDLGSLTERFRTRFSRYEVKPPSDAAVAQLLIEQHGVPDGIAAGIASLAGGNVRAAILDAESWKNQQPEPAAPIGIQTSLAALGL